jgi:lipoyl(octanoyl) transferase
VEYGRALTLQQECARRALEEGAGPLLLLLEHPPTVTLGRQARRENLRLTESEYHARGIELFQIQRGGDVTAHAPGQLVGYPIASLSRLKASVPQWVKGHAEALRRVLARRGIDARWSDIHPGLWVEKRKIAAFGFQISRGVSRHGFALNVNNDLSLFDTIVPCGLRHLGVTSMAALGHDASCAALAPEVAREVAREFGADVPTELGRDEFLARLAAEPPNRCEEAGGGA